jgi:hypothetical protein
MTKMMSQNNAPHGKHLLQQEFGGGVVQKNSEQLFDRHLLRLRWPIVQLWWNEWFGSMDFVG